MTPEQLIETLQSGENIEAELKAQIRTASECL
jgi:hypothetical protein